MNAREVKLKTENTIADKMSIFYTYKNFLVSHF